jgi:hypothetical protein
MPLKDFHKLAFAQGGSSRGGNPQGPADPALDRPGPGTKWGPASQLTLRGPWSGVKLPQDQHESRQFPVGIRGAQLVQQTGTGPGPKRGPPSQLTLRGTGLG